jgi:hypothetical protein
VFVAWLSVSAPVGVEIVERCSIGRSLLGNEAGAVRVGLVAGFASLVGYYKLNLFIL